MKKGYIVTWFNSGRNYGQTLQAFALQKKLKLLNYDVAVINYNGGHVSHNRIMNYLKRRRQCSCRTWDIQRKFDNFVQNNITLTPPLLSHSEISGYLKKEEPDFLICGSDQIWNPHDLSRVYFLHEMGTDKTTKIAYAVSLCDKRYMGKFLEQAQVKEWIKDFDTIYVRENTGKDILQELYGQTSEVVLDPTLLFSGQEWVSMLKLKKQKQRNYILCYAFNLSDAQLAYIQNRAKERDADVVYGDILLNRNVGKRNKSWSPVDFLEKIYNAQEVITDSFHGTVFSVLFHKPFWVFDNGTDADSDPYYNIDRMNTFLEKLNLQWRVTDLSEAPMEAGIDYDVVDDILAKEREKCTERLGRL